MVEDDSREKPAYQKENDLNKYCCSLDMTLSESNRNN